MFTTPTTPRRSERIRAGNLRGTGRRRRNREDDELVKGAKSRWLYKEEIATRRYVDVRINRGKSTHRCPSYQNNGNLLPSSSVQVFQVGANIAKGDNAGNRTGDTIDVKSLHIHGHAFNYNTSPFQSGMIRMLVVKVKFPWETITDDFFASDSAAAVPNNFTTNQRGAMTRQLNPNKFMVVWDKTIPLPVWNDQDHSMERRKNTAIGGIQYFSYRIPLNKRVKFEDGGTAASDIMPAYKVIWWVVSNYHNPAADFPANTVGHQFYIDTYFKDI